jgi:hypothetical protein
VNLLSARPTWWPRDPHGYVFLGQAIDEIGRAKFKEWTGTEPDTKDVALLPSLAEADHWAKGHADRLLTDHRPDLPPRRCYHLSDPEFVDEQWTVAFDLARRLHDERRPALERLRSVQDEISAACEAGILVTAVRGHDGKMQECPRQWWNTEQLESRFSRCKLNPRDPFDDHSLAARSDDHLWIFVTGASLHQFTARLGSLPASSDQTVVILEAKANLWPKGIPPGLRVKEQEAMIAAWLKEHGRHVPTEEALKKAFQRARRGTKNQ